jgi:DNA-binding winged helix-turn-helix (wHTH) protein
MSYSGPFTLGDWRVEPRAGRISGPDGERELEPKVMDLLCLLAEAEGEVVSRETIAGRIWPGVTVNDDALGRCVWKLRRALGDPARTPRYVATVPKRGYRLLEPAVPQRLPPPVRAVPKWIWGVTGALLLLMAFPAFWLLRTSLAPAGEPEARAERLTDRADDFYYQFEASGNDAAMRLYEAALELEPDLPRALAGLANTVTQSVLRSEPQDWPGENGTSRVGAALASGRTREPEAIRRLERAEALARRAIAANPDYPLGYRALGLALSSQGELDAAIEAYNRALTLDPDAWQAWINLSDMHDLKGEPGLALTYMERAYEAMSRVYDEQTVLIRPWYSPTGLSIARAHAGRDDAVTAELWYRRVLYWDPYNRDATRELAALLRENGDAAAADALCAEGAARTGDAELCGG